MTQRHSDGTRMDPLEQIRFRIEHAFTEPTERTTIDIHNILLEIVDYLEEQTGDK